MSTKASAKDAILGSALRLFVERGIGNTPTALITRDAGYSEATLFVHFKNKQGLIDAVYLAAKQRQHDAFAAIPLNDDAEQSLTNLYVDGVAYFVAHHHEALFLHQVFNGNFISPEARAIVEQDADGFVTTHGTWRAHGAIKDVNLDLYVMIIWSALFDMTNYCRAHALAGVPAHLRSMLWDTLRRT